VLINYSSWHSAAQALTDPDLARRNAYLQGFLADETVKGILSHPLDPFERPSAETKSSFETRTAPSQVTRNEKSGYNIDEIKKDAAWLCEKVKIDEITALRVVVIEWQGRAAERLRHEVLGPNQDADSVDPTGLGSNNFAPSTSILTAPYLGEAEGYTHEERRQHRYLKIWIQEKVSVIRLVEILVLSAIDRKYQLSAEKRLRGMEAPLPEEELGDELLDKQERLGSRFLIQAIGRVCKLIDLLAVGSTWLKDDMPIPELEEAWGRCTLMEVIFVQKLILLHLFCSTTLTEVDLALHWYRTMERYSFFASWQPVSTVFKVCGLHANVVQPFETQLPLLNIIHVTVSLISLVILQVNAAVSFLQSPQEAAGKESNYMSDVVAFNDIHNFITNNASAGPGPATLAALHK
jgi:nuclear pore complex protein Nup188